MLGKLPFSCLSKAFDYRIIVLAKNHQQEGQKYKDRKDQENRPSKHRKSGRKEQIELIEPVVFKGFDREFFPDGHKGTTYNQYGYQATEYRKRGQFFFAVILP